MTRSRRFLAVLVLLVTAAVLLVVAPALVPSPPVAESTYGYGLSLDTNATLENVTVLVPLPVTATGSGPVADALAAGAADAPRGWNSDVVDSERGPALRLRADEVPAERRPDGRLYSTYHVGVTVPADHVVETAAPFGPEPTMASADDRRTRPCPNRVGDDTERSCFGFDSWLFLSYDAPADAEVGLVLVNNGVNVYRDGGHAMYYERLQVAFDGPQDGWVTVDGFGSTEPTSE